MYANEGITPYGWEGLFSKQTSKSGTERMLTANLHASVISSWVFWNADVIAPANINVPLKQSEVMLKLSVQHWPVKRGQVFQYTY